jgi:hypothetical protein
MDGKSPTARERWQAFYRLWRMIANADKRSGREIQDPVVHAATLTNADLAFTVLLEPDDWGWLIGFD